MLHLEHDSSVLAKLAPKFQRDRLSQPNREDWSDVLKDKLDPAVLELSKKHIGPEISKCSIVSQVADFQPYSAKICLSSNGKNAAMNGRKVLGDQAPRFDLITSLEPVNGARYVNKYLESVNESLDYGGYLIGCVETVAQRRDRLFRTIPSFIRNIFLAFDFLVHDFWPKVTYLNKFYFFLTEGRVRLISRMEILGRLYSCGYVMLDCIDCRGRMFFIVQKQGKPDYCNEATYGPLIRLRRVGMHGKVLSFYKFRTMYPYSEYLQQYLFEKNGLAKGGKFREDERITPEGRFARKYFLDEIPMLINLIKGDLKLFGVRPLSEHYLSLYPKDYREYRTKFRPGLIPPYYADRPDTIEEIVASEKMYLDSFERNPLRTDISYTLKTLYQIIFRNARSS